MRYIIHGSGAIGSLLGGWLKASGADVVLIARPAHAEAINARGLTIQSRDGDRQIAGLAAVTSPHAITSQKDDVLMLVVKSQQTNESIHQLREVFSENTPIFCMQNGIRNEQTAAERFRRVYGAMVDFSATFLEPGVIAHTRANRIALGNYPLGRDKLVAVTAEQLLQAGFDVTTHDHVMTVKWCKLLLNLNNATHAITNTYVQLSHVQPRASHFMADVIQEAITVLNAAGISLKEERNPFDVPAYVAKLRSVTEDAAAIREARKLPDELRTWPSTLVDLRNQRGATESSYFNGEIILLGEKYFVPTPYNTVLFNTVEKMAVEQQEPGRYTIDDLIEMVAEKRRELSQA